MSKPKKEGDELREDWKRQAKNLIDKLNEPVVIVKEGHRNNLNPQGELSAVEMTAGQIRRRRAALESLELHLRERRP